MLGHVRQEYDVPNLEPERVECWKGLVKVLCAQPSISSLAIRLSWTCPRTWSSDLQNYPQDHVEEKKQEERKRREKGKVMFKVYLQSGCRSFVVSVNEILIYISAFLESTEPEGFNDFIYLEQSHVFLFIFPYISTACKYDT
jgi:hypothetical protein